MLAAAEFPPLSYWHAHRDVAVSVVAEREFAIGQHGAGSGRRIEGGDTRTASPQALRQGALRDQLQLYPASEVVIIKFRQDRERGRQAPDPALCQQPSDAGEIATDIVDDDVQVAAIQVAQCIEQRVRPSRAAESADSHRGARWDRRQRVHRIGAELVDHSMSFTQCPPEGRGSRWDVAEDSTAVSRREPGFPRSRSARRRQPADRKPRRRSFVFREVKRGVARAVALAPSWTGDGRSPLLRSRYLRPPSAQPGKGSK